MEVPKTVFSYKTQTQNKNGLSSQKKKYLNENVTPSLEKTNTSKENAKIIFCDNIDKNKTLEEDYTKIRRN